jgi:hypothetical protein
MKRILPVRTKCDETTLYRPVLELFAKEQDYVFCEVPYFGKRVDLVLSGKALRTLHAIEIKIRDWQGALKQAAINQLFAHYSYVALPEAKVQALRPEQRDAFTRYHVGLISVGQNAVIEIPAVQNGYFHAAHYDVVKNLLKKASSRTPKKLGAIRRAITNRQRTLELLQVGAHSRKRAL